MTTPKELFSIQLALEAERIPVTLTLRAWTMFMAAAELGSDVLASEDKQSKPAFCARLLTELVEMQVKEHLELKYEVQSSTRKQ